jgi:reactive intermediate/imine deaminase
MMAQKQVVDPGFTWAAPYQYSQAVRAGDLLFLAGQVAVDATGAVVGEGDIRAQARQVFENLKAVLAAAGSSLDDVVEMTSFHTDMADLEGVAEIKAEYLAGDFPAWTAIGTTGLAFPGLLLEIKVVALAH